MERSSTWRPIEPDEPDSEEAVSRVERSPTDDGTGLPALRIALAGVAGAAVLVAPPLLLWAGTPQAEVRLEGGASALTQPEGEPGAVAPSGGATGDVLVDVQGAVVQPGLHRLASSSRVGDAIAAAGGYSPLVDLFAAAERLNLAEKLADGGKIYVPARGDPTPAAPLGMVGQLPTLPTGGETQPALIDVNSASQAQLETLPGIGPVTAAKIIGARQEAPFAAVDDLLARDVVGPATFEKIRGLITVAP